MLAEGLNLGLADDRAAEAKLGKLELVLGVADKVLPQCGEQEKSFGCRIRAGLGGLLQALQVLRLKNSRLADCKKVLTDGVENDGVGD